MITRGSLVPSELPASSDASLLALHIYMKLTVNYMKYIHQK